MPLPDVIETRYCCPGQKYAVSRAVHLGRLARFFPLCRQCSHREDTGTLSPRQVRKLRADFGRAPHEPRLDAEAVWGIWPQALTPAVVRQWAASFGLFLHRATADGAFPAVAIGGDGRLLTAELLAAAAEGLRWSGCNVVELGSVFAAMLVFAVDHLQLSGGMLVGNPLGGSHTAGLKFYGNGPRPLSAPGELSRVAAVAAGPLDRPARRYGGSRRFDPREPYRDTLHEFYHALRPLRLAVYVECQPVRDCLQALTATVACRIVPAANPAELPQKVRAEAAHFAAEIADDGEICRLWDEQGRPVDAERLLALMARHLLAEQPQGAVVLEPGATLGLSRAIEQWGGRAIRADDSARSTIDETMRRQQAILGGGPSGRLWHGVGYPSADALRTVSRLLVLLSRSDRRLSEVLDAEAAIE